jgi:hypothetical protein
VSEREHSFQQGLDAHDACAEAIKEKDYMNE